MGAKLGIAEMLGNRDKKQTLLVKKKMLLANKIHEAMETNGLSQKKFASLMKKNQSEICKWLRGDHNFTLETLIDIERILKVELVNVKIVTKPSLLNYLSTETIANKKYSRLKPLSRELSNSVILPNGRIDGTKSQDTEASSQLECPNLYSETA
jgi:transcriptional regulator with XRE-family HTH domain